MTTSVIELSKRLQRSLDSNYNVIDLVAVFEIIRILEGTPITTEQLETTRLAKYINQLRRKTTNEQLARQAKNLLKKWRDNLMPTISAAASSSSTTVAAASSSSTQPVVAAAAPPSMTNGMPLGVRSQPTTPSRPIYSSVLNHHHHHQQGNSNSNDRQVITIPDDENDSKSQGSSQLRRFAGSQMNNNNNNNNNGGGGLTIPTELTNFYLKNKKIIDATSEIRVNHQSSPASEQQQVNNFNHSVSAPVAAAAPSLAVPGADLEEDAVAASDGVLGKKQRRGRKKGSKGVDSLMGSSSLFNSNSNSGFVDGGGGGAASTVGKKVKTTRQLVADLKFRNEQNLRNSSNFGDLSNDHHQQQQENNNNNNHNKESSPASPLSMASNDSHHMFHHHHHNQHATIGSHSHDQNLFHSAPVTPLGGSLQVKREGEQQQEESMSAKKREKKRRRMEKERAAQAELKARKKREKTPPPASGMNFLNQVDEDIWQLKRKLPPIDRKAILRQMKAESLAQAQATDRQCTCQLVECSQEEAERACGVIVASLDDILAPLESAESPALPGTSASLADVDSPTGSTSPSLDQQQQPSTSQSLPPPVAPPVHVVRNKKSIFDDDDALMEEASPSHQSTSALLLQPPPPDKNNNSEEEDRIPFSRATIPQQQLQPPPPPQPHHQQAPPLPIVIHGPGGAGLMDDEGQELEAEEERIFYKFLEESNCPIKRRKEDLLRLNEDYHLAALHQLYIPGVNGNWSAFPDLGILTQQAMQTNLGISTQQAIQTNSSSPTSGSSRRGVKRKRKRSSSDDDDNEGDSNEEGGEGAKQPQKQKLYNNSRVNPNNQNGELIKCLERLQDTETRNVEAVVPLVNPFFYFLKPEGEQERRGEGNASTGGSSSTLANMAGLLPRFVPLRTDFGIVIMPATEEVAPPSFSNSPPPIQFNRELAKELGIEGVCEGLKGDVYEPRELSKFLEAVLRQRLPKFQMANLFYKRSWPGSEDRAANLSLELLNSLYLNRVLEFRRRRKQRRRVIRTVTHRKRRRKGVGHGEGESETENDDEKERDDEIEDEIEEIEEEVEVADVHVFDGFLEMHTTDKRGRFILDGNQSARRLFYVNDDREFGHQRSILEDVPADDRLPLLDDWDLFRVRWQALEFLPPVLSATARLLYSSWPRLRWNFLLDYFKYRQRGLTEEQLQQEEEDGGEVIRIHENNFRLPSFNQLTEENVLGIRQRRGRISRSGGEEGEGDEEESSSVLPAKVKLQVESFRERDFIRVCMEKWPQLFAGISFDYDEGLLVMRHADVDTRWRFMCEFGDMLKEVTRLGVQAEEEGEEEKEEEVFQLKNGFSTARVKMEVDSDDEDEGANAVRKVDVPQVELFKEWHESVQVQSYNDELLTILPYVVID